MVLKCILVEGLIFSVSPWQVFRVIMIRISPITQTNVLTFKSVRLGALQESPSAFGSTYAKEAQLTGADWIERTVRWNGERGAGFLAIDEADGTACGMVGTFLDQDDSARAHLIAMWTAPTHRQQGVGRLLVNAVIAWARERGARTVLLMVTSNNEPALAFYHQLGFTRNGRTEPYPNDPALIEYEMSMPI